MPTKGGHYFFVFLFFFFAIYSLMFKYSYKKTFSLLAENNNRQHLATIINR